MLLNEPICIPFKAGSKVSVNKSFQMLIDTGGRYGNANTHMEIPTIGTDLYNGSINWGDGNSEGFYGTTPTLAHDYDVVGEYVITIKGIFPRISFASNTTYAVYVLDILNFGTVGWTNMTSAFAYCSYLRDVKGMGDFSNVTTLNSMFNSARGLRFVDISKWNLGPVTDTARMFYRTEFDVHGPDLTIVGLDSFDFTNVINSWAMFCSSKVADLSGIANWNTSNVNSMYSMFCIVNNNTQFPIANWDISNVRSMSGLFSYTTTLEDSYYDEILTKWSAQSVNSNLAVDFGDAKYSTTGSTYRDILINTYGWTITDGGPA